CSKWSSSSDPGNRSMTLEQKIEKAKQVITEHITANTVLYCSFGKDSMAMLHITLGMGLRLPVIYNHIPYFPAKQQFANSVIENWELTVHRFPPLITAFRAH